MNEMAAKRQLFQLQCKSQGKNIEEKTLERFTVVRIDTIDITHIDNSIPSEKSMKIRFKG